MTPTPTLLDTSAAVAFLVADHEAHERTFSSLRSRSLGLAGHAWFETFSVLTRLPGSARRDPATVVELLESNFPNTRFLDETTSTRLATELRAHAIGGGAVYDALVAAAAEQHGLTLMSRDRRALGTYRSFDVDVELLD